MLLRVVDYVANPGGGIRFVVELLIALANSSSDIRIELVSDADGLARYRPLIESRMGRVRLVERAPRCSPYLERHQWRFLPGARWMYARLFGVRSLWRWDVSPEMFTGADAVWFPWVHRHAAPPRGVANVVGTYHDAIMLQFPGVLPAALRQIEFDLEREWYQSNSWMVVSSAATQSTVETLFGSPTRPISTIRLSAAHALHIDSAPLPSTWGWSERPFLLYPANTSLHKNHETLLAAFGMWRRGIPLVLCGGGTNFVDGALDQRGATLRAAAADAGLLADGRLVTLGYVSDPVYYTLMRRAWAVVMPTLAEGGGSFPAMEAMQAGIPVICSDIPVLREQVAFYGGRPLWFDPLAARDLANRFEDLRLNYDRERRAAVAASSGMLSRSWNDVADDYMKIFKAAAAADSHSEATV